VPEFEHIKSAAGLIIPEIVLLATVCAMFLIGPFLTTDSGAAAPGLRHRCGTLALIGLGFAWLVWFTGQPTSDNLGPFRVDGLTWFIRGVSLSLGAVLALLLWNQIDDAHSAEAHACLLSMIAGVNLTACANDLVALFLALELVSIPTYVLLYLPKRDRAMREATVKYFMLSVFSAALFLYGLSWLFGAAGTTSFVGIAHAAAGERLSNIVMVKVAMMFILAGIGFRITAVPFHFYAPDVFQGVTSSAAAMLSFIPKIVGFVALLRLIPLASGVLLPEAWSPPQPTRDVLAVLAVLTMFGGNLLALRQKNLHRLLAYSSVAHAGYMLTGLVVGGGAGAVSGLTAMLFYLVVYGVTTIGVFALLAGISTPEMPVQSDAQIAGLSRTQPVTALLLAVCLFGLTGLPPTAGFLGKLNLFLAAWSSGTLLGQGLAAALAVNAAIAAWYYLRLVSLMYLEPAPQSEPLAVQPPAWIAGGICAAATIVLFALPQWLWDSALRAAG
jgi:NADH-quinone oxidoreductase subunit N